MRKLDGNRIRTSVREREGKEREWEMLGSVGRCVPGVLAVVAAVQRAKFFLHVCENISWVPHSTALCYLSLNWWIEGSMELTS